MLPLAQVPWHYQQRQLTEHLKQPKWDSLNFCTYYGVDGLFSKRLKATTLRHNELYPQGVYAYAIHPCAARTSMQDPFVGNDRAQKGWALLGVRFWEASLRLSKSILTYLITLQPYLVDDPLIAGGFTVWLTTDKANHLAGRYLSANDDVDEVYLKRKDEILKEDFYKLRVTGIPAIPSFVEM